MLEWVKEIFYLNLYIGPSIWLLSALAFIEPAQATVTTAAAVHLAIWFLAYWHCANVLDRKYADDTTDH
jgi:hypothetical protein